MKLSQVVAIYPLEYSRTVVRPFAEVRNLIDTALWQGSAVTHLSVIGTTIVKGR